MVGEGEKGIWREVPDLWGRWQVASLGRAHKGGRYEEERLVDRGGLVRPPSGREGQERAFPGVETPGNGRTPSGRSESVYGAEKSVSWRSCLWAIPPWSDSSHPL